MRKMNESAQMSVNGGGVWYCSCGRVFTYNCITAPAVALIYNAHVATCKYK